MYINKHNQSLFCSGEHSSANLFLYFFGTEYLFIISKFIELDIIFKIKFKNWLWVWFVVYINNYITFRRDKSKLTQMISNLHSYQTTVAKTNNKNTIIVVAVGNCYHYYYYYLPRNYAPSIKCGGMNFFKVVLNKIIINHFIFKVDIPRILLGY